MEASFRARIDRTFGFLSDGETHFWNVEERAASQKNTGLSHGAAGEEGSDDEEASGYADFLNSGSAQGREGQGERRGASFFGEGDLEELDSGDDDDDGGDEDDVDEEMRVGKKLKKKGGGEQIDTELGKRVGEDGGGAAEPPKLEADDGDDDDEVQEVREMVGMDDTLDFEEEEDEYDKVAVGSEGTDDRLFMSQVRNFGASRQQLNPLPTSFIEMRQAGRDRRANHEAALARLEEDDREAATRATEELSQAKEEYRIQEVDHIVEEPKMVEDLPARQDSGGGEAMDIDGDGHNEDPVAGKRRKPGKRVRFSIDEAAGAESDPGRPDQTSQIATPDVRASSESTLIASTYPVNSSTASSVSIATPNRYSRVPDYVKNPSKYIHYTLDWSDEDEEKANMAAFHAARAVSSSTQDMVTDKQEELAPLESQGPSAYTKISFNPLVSSLKRSSSKESSKDSREMGADALAGVPTTRVINVAANFDMDSNMGGIITMEDDQDSIRQEKSNRVVRRYRSRVTDETD